jgi:predicted transcriptional regulator
MNTHRAVRQYLAKEEKKTELKSERVELGIIDDIEKLKKESQKFLSDSNKSDAAVQKAVSQIKDKSQFWLNNKKFAANLEKRANGLFNKYEKAAKELGLDVKNSPASKEYFDILDIGSQIDDNIQNIVGAIKSIK